MRVAFIGLGAMGRPMAANLAREHDVVVVNRTRRVADEHAAEHTTTAADLDQIGEVHAVITCLPVTADVAEVATTLAGQLAPGTLWLDATSGDPFASRELAGWLGDRGIRYLDTPVSGGTNGAAAGTLTVMVGGSAKDLAEARPLLEPMAGLIVHVGPVSSGHAVKAINNTLLAANLASVVEGLVALRGLDIDPTAALEVFNHASGRSFATEHPVPERVVSRTFENTFALGLLHKDVGLAIDVVDAVGDAAPVLRAVASTLAAATTSVGPEHDHTALARHIESEAGRSLG